jgi:hypothetical protein
MYICGMDLAPAQGLLYMCAFSQEATTMNLPCLNVYATGAEYSYKWVHPLGTQGHWAIGAGGSCLDGAAATRHASGPAPLAAPIPSPLHQPPHAPHLATSHPRPPAG